MPSLSLIIALLFGALVVVWWFFGREKIGQPFPNTLLKKYKKTPLDIMLLWALRALVLILTSLLWIEPSIDISTPLQKESGRQIIITLDISNSMKADDIAPSRLDRAKEVIENFLHQDREDAIGYVVFAGRAFLLSPLTHDRDGVKSLVERTTTDTIDQSEKDTSGTNIGDAIIAGIGGFENMDDTREKILILITDGRANIGISPIMAADEAKKRAIKIYTIGIGSASGGVLSYRDTRGIRQYFYNQTGEQVIADIDEPTLREIADRTGGRYFHAENIGLLESVFAELDTLVGSPPMYEDEIRSMSLSPLLALGIVGLMILHGFLMLSIRRKYKSS